MVTIKGLKFTRGKVQERNYTELPDLAEIKDGTTMWIDVTDYDSAFLEELAGKIGIDPLTVEDIVLGEQRVKLEEYPEYIYTVSKGVFARDKIGLGYHIDELSAVIRNGLVVTFHPQESRVINSVMKSVTNRAATIRDASHFTATVLHSIYDFSVDSFYGVASNIESWLLTTGGNILDVDKLKPSDLSDMKSVMRQIARARGEINSLRIILSQHRDVVSMLQRGAVKNVSTDFMTQFRDVYDHTFQLIETLDAYMLRTNDLRDLYFTLRAAFTDNILKLLTIVATIFLPLSFLTGFYGMNFTSGFFEPGSDSLVGLYVLVGVMVLISLGLVVMFRRKGWI